MKPLIVLFALAAAITLATSAATISPARAAGPECQPTTTLLPDLGFGGQALAIQGETVVGSVLNPAHRSLPAFWHDGELTLIPDLTRGFAGDINPRGDIVGSSGGAAPFSFVNGATHLLPHNPGPATARRINARGQIAGTVGNVAARWESYASDPILLLPASGDSFAFAKGINDVGEVAGDTDDADFVPRSAIWDRAGQLHVLASGFGADEPSDLFAINNRGVSTGESFLGGDFGPTADQATSWSRDGVPSLIPLLPVTTASIGLELNDLGWVSGIAVDFDFATGEEHGHHAFVWFGKGPSETLPVTGRSYADSESDAHYVTDDGTVVGSSGPVGGPDSATVWTCTQTQAYVPDADVRADNERGQATFPGEPGRIAFMSNRGGNLDIYTVEQNGRSR